jgi:hypothetical protein
VELLTFSIAAGETKTFMRAGRYFEIIEAAGSLNVELVGADGAQSDDMRGAVSGMYSEGPYSQIEISSGQSQSVTVMLSDGRGGSRRQPGMVRVIDEITDALGVYRLLPALGVVAWTPTAIIAPAANTKGIIVRGSEVLVQPGAGGTAQAGFVTAKAVPSSNSVPSQQWKFASLYSNNAAAVAMQTEKSNKLIPPGWGLFGYHEILVAGANICGGTLWYEVLV